MADHVISVTLTGNAGQLTSVLQQTNTQIAQLVQSISAMGSRTGGAAAGVGSAARATGQLSSQAGSAYGNVNRLNSASRSMNSIMGAMAGQTTLMGKAMAGLGTYAQQTAAIFLRWMGPYQIIRMIESGIRFLISSFMDFDLKMAESTAIMHNLSASMREQLGNAAKDVAENTKFSASQAAEGLYFIASAGFDAKASLEVLPVVANFAMAGVMDLGKASEYLMDTTRAMGLVAYDSYGNIAPEQTKKNMEELSDVMTKTAIVSNATVEQVAQAMSGRAAAMFRILGKTKEELAGVVAAYASVGIKGDTASTQIYMATRDLQKAALNSAEGFQQLGVQVYDSQGKMNNFGTIMQQMSHALHGMSDEAKKGALMQLGLQDRSQAAILAVMDLGTQMKITEAKMKLAGGTTQEVAEKQMAAFSNQIVHMKNLVGNFAADAGYALVNFFAEVGKRLTPLKDEFVTAFQDIRANVENFINAVKPFAAAVAGLSFGAITGTLTTLLNILNRFPAAMTVVSAMFMTWAARAVLGSSMVTGAVGRVTTQVQMMSIAFNNQNMIGGGMFASLASKAGQAYGYIQGKAPQVAGGLASIGNAAKAAGTGMKAMGSLFMDAAPGIITAIMLISAEFENQHRVAKEAADSFGKGLSESTFNDYIKKTNVLIAEAGRRTDEYNQKFGENPLWEFDMGKQGKIKQFWENLTPGDNVYGDMEHFTQEFQEKAGKMRNTTMNIQQAWESFGKQTGATREEIYQAAKALDIDLSKPIDWKVGEGKVQWEMIQEQIKGTRIQYSNFATEAEVSGAQASGSMEGLAESAKKVRDGVASAFSGLTDPVKKYNDALIKSLGLNEIFSEMMDELKTKAEAQESVAKDALDANRAARDDATQANIDSQISALEQRKQAELDAINQQKREASQAQKASNQDEVDAISDTTTDKVDAIKDGSKKATKATRNATEDQRAAARDQKQATSRGSQDVVDGISDATTAERNSIEARYKAQEDQIRRGADATKRAQDAADKAQDTQTENAKKKAEQEGTYIKPKAQNLNDTMDKSVKKAEEYRSKINEAIGKGASSDLVQFFESLKPEEAMPIIQSFIDNYETEMKRFDEINDRRKKAQAPTAEEMLKQLGQSSEDMKNMQGNIMTLAQGGVDPAGVQALVAKFKDQAPQMLKTLVEKLNSGPAGAAEVQKIINQYAQFNDANIQKTVDEMSAAAKVIYGNYQIASGDVEKGKATLTAALATMSPEAIAAKLKELGFDKQLAYTMTDQVRGIYDTLELETRNKWVKMMYDLKHGTYEEAKATADVWDKVGGGYHPATPNPPPGGNADGNVIKFFAQGGYENHVAQIAQPASTYRVWAEKETGGEAYIPLAQSKRERSESILSTVANMFGYSLALKKAGAASGVYGGQPARTWTNNTTSDSWNNSTINNFIGVPVERAIVYSQRQQALKLTGRQR